MLQRSCQLLRSELARIVGLELEVSKGAEGRYSERSFRAASKRPRSTLPENARSICSLTRKSAFVSSPSRRISASGGCVVQPPVNRCKVVWFFKRFHSDPTVSSLTGRLLGCQLLAPCLLKLKRYPWQRTSARRGARSSSGRSSGPSGPRCSRCCCLNDDYTTMDFVIEVLEDGLQQAACRGLPDHDGGAHAGQGPVRPLPA